MQYGVSFQPGQSNGQEGPHGERRAAPVQEAVRLLSLRLPTVTGARGIAPQELLHSQGAAGADTGAFSLESALEMLRRLRGTNVPPQLQFPQSGSSQQPTQAPVSTKLPQPDRRTPEIRFDQPASSQQRPRQDQPSRDVPVFTPGPPRIIPGDDRPTPEVVFAPSAPTPTPPQVVSLPDPEPEQAPSPWTRPGRNPRLAEKYLGDFFDG